MAKLTVITVLSKTNTYYSIGLEFTQSPKVLSVADKAEDANTAKGIITQDQATELRADPFITVIEGEGKEVSSEQAQALQAANAELEALRADNAKLKADLLEAQAALGASAAAAASATALVKK